MWRRPYLTLATALALVSAGFAFLGQLSGGPFKRAIRNAALAARNRPRILPPVTLLRAVHDEHIVEAAASP